MSKTITCNDLIAVDIDETLVFMVKEDQEHDFVLQDPYEVLGTLYLKKHNPNINCVKRGYARGLRYFAWSMAGALWAEVVLKALGIYDMMEVVMTKPIRYIDDKPVSEWMTDRTCLEPDMIGWQKDGCQCPKGGTE